MRYRIVACLISALAILIPTAVYVLHISMLGFPDGHRTELDLFDQKLFLPYSVVSVGLGLWAARLAYGPASEKRKRQLIVVVGAFVVTMVSACAAAAWARSSLDAGIGG